MCMCLCIHVCVCAHVCVHVPVCIHVHMCVHVCIAQRSKSDAFLCSSPSVLTQAVSLNLDRANLASLAVHQSLGILLSLPPSTEVIGWIVVPDFYVGAGDLNSGPHGFPDSSFTYRAIGSPRLPVFESGHLLLVCWSPSRYQLLFTVSLQYFFCQLSVTFFTLLK